MKKFLILLFPFFLCSCSAINLSNSSIYPNHNPYGKGIGINPGEVVWGQDPNAVTWDGEGYWWNESNFNTAIIRNLLNKSLEELTDTTSPKESWDTVVCSHPIF